MFCDFTNLRTQHPLHPLSSPLVLSVAVHQSWEQAGQEADAILHLAVCPASALLLCPLGRPHSSKESAGPGSTEFLLQALDELVVEEQQLTMGQETGEDALNAVGP